MVRDQIGSIASFKVAIIVKRLPKTRSGKILRGIMKKIADGESYCVPATIDDPVILNEIRDSLKAIGYPKKKFSWKICHFYLSLSFFTIEYHLSLIDYSHISQHSIFFV